MKKIRKWTTGADRDIDEGKLDFEGFLNPFVLEVYAQYMNKHRIRKDKTLRESDNWQKGLPKEVYMKSLLRHVFSLWRDHRNKDNKDKQEQLCAILFNAQGYLYELLAEGKPDMRPRDFNLPSSKKT